VLVLTGEPTISTAFLESIIMMTVIKVLVFLRLKRKKQFLSETPVTDIWLYEEGTLRKMLTETGFVDITIRGFGFLAPLFNGPSSLFFKIITGKSMQPDLWWKTVGFLDRVIFSWWVPKNYQSHFVIAARKPTK
jgi:hypothetical protein